MNDIIKPEAQSVTERLAALPPEVQALFADPENGTPDDISQAGCLALARLGKDAWNAWREAFPVTGKIFEFKNFADFAGVDFRGSPLDFSGFEFGDGACFRESKWGDRARFYEATWGVKADFTNSRWGNAAIFTRAKWGRLSDFNGAQWGDGAYFTDCQWGDNARFQTAEWGCSANFSGARWIGSVDFSNTKWGGQANFTGAKCTKSANFKNTYWAGAAFFPGAKWEGDVSFSGSMWCGSAFFNGMHCTGVAYFSFAHWGSMATFSNARFEGSAFFNGAVWAQSAVFSASYWGGNADFSGNSLKEIIAFIGDEDRGVLVKQWSEDRGVSPDIFDEVIFAGAYFVGEVDFSNRKFTGKSDFGRLSEDYQRKWALRHDSGQAMLDDAGDLLWETVNDPRSHVLFAKAPKFHGCELHQDTSFDGAEFPPASGSDEAARAYRTLKLAFSKQQALREEQRFFKLEMEEEALREQGLKRRLFWAYKYFSDYGFSVRLPLCWALRVSVFLFLVYGALSWGGNCLLADACEFAPQWLTFSLLHTLPVPGVDKMAEAAGKVFLPKGGWWELGVSMLVILHKAVVIAALFLAGLALRNLFRLK